MGRTKESAKAAFERPCPGATQRNDDGTLPRISPEGVLLDALLSTDALTYKNVRFRPHVATWYGEIQRKEVPARGFKTQLEAAKYVAEGLVRWAARGQSSTTSHAIPGEDNEDDEGEEEDEDEDEDGAEALEAGEDDNIIRLRCSGCGRSCKGRKGLHIHQGKTACGLASASALPPPSVTWPPNEGDRVERIEDDDLLPDTFGAVIIKKTNDVRYEIMYDTLVENDGRYQTEEVNIDDLRPEPPPVDDRFFADLKVGQAVDLFADANGLVDADGGEGWWLASIVSIESDGSIVVKMAVSSVFDPQDPDYTPDITLNRGQAQERLRPSLEYHPDGWAPATITIRDPHESPQDASQWEESQPRDVVMGEASGEALDCQEVRVRKLIDDYAHRKPRTLARYDIDADQIAEAIKVLREQKVRQMPKQRNITERHVRAVAAALAYINDNFAKKQGAYAREFSSEQKGLVVNPVLVSSFWSKLPRTRTQAVQRPHSPPSRSAAAARCTSVRAATPQTRTTVAHRTEVTEVTLSKAKTLAELEEAIQDDSTLLSRINDQGVDGRTALHTQIHCWRSKDSLKVITRLLELGIDWKICDNEGRKASAWAMECILSPKHPIVVLLSHFDKSETDLVAELAKRMISVPADLPPDDANERVRQLALLLVKNGAAVPSPPEFDSMLVKERDDLHGIITSQIALADLSVHLPELCGAINKLKELHAQKEGDLPPLDTNLVHRANNKYMNASHVQKSMIEHRLEALVGTCELEHVKNIFETARKSAPCRFDVMCRDGINEFTGCISKARSLALDKEKIDNADQLRLLVLDTTKRLIDVTLRPDEPQTALMCSPADAAISIKVCEVLVEYGIETMAQLCSLGSKQGEFDQLQGLSSDLQRELLDRDFLREARVKKLDMQKRLERVRSLFWLPVGVSADESIALLRNCDHNYQGKLDSLKLSAMESLEHGCFEVAKACYLTYQTTLAAAKDFDDDGFIKIKACFHQLRPSDTGDIDITKHHNMLKLIGPSKSGKSVLATYLARLYVASAEEPAEGRWAEMEPILADNSKRTIWVVDILGQPVKIWGPLKYLWHLAKNRPKARFALVMPEANRGDIFSILGANWFEPRNRLGNAGHDQLTDADPPPNLCIIFTENPATGNSAFRVMNGDEALGTRLTKTQTVAVDHGRVHDGMLIGQTQPDLYNPELRIDMKDFANAWCKSHGILSASLAALREADGSPTSTWRHGVLWDIASPTPDVPTTIPGFVEAVRALHVGDQHKLCDLLLQHKKKRAREEEAHTRRVAQRADAPAAAAARP